jgi:hypothetical protein
LYVNFALYSTDGSPLDKASKISLSLVSTSFNTGFSLGTGKNPHKAGDLPVLVARVGGTVKAPALEGMRYTLRDWHLKDIGTGVVQNGTFTLPSDKPVFFVEFTR